jgi:DNA polymerase III gamma/tau subunit
MKILILIFLIISNNILKNDISKINKLTKNAEKAFKEKNYKIAINDYNTLIDSFNISNKKIHLNLAHSYLLNNDTLKAIKNYNMASVTNDKKIKSIAYQQLGNINESKNKLKNAAEFYKKSILSNNSNLDSKYNYELVTKKLKEHEKKKQEKKKQENKEQNNKEKENKNQENKNKKQEKKKQENKEQNNKKQENKKQEKSIEEKLKEINMSKKKAEMILNALNNIEFKYIQQLKRKASKKIDKNKPDW